MFRQMVVVQVIPGNVLQLCINIVCNFSSHDFNFTFMHGCETWSLSLREVHRLRVLENRLLKRIFECKRMEVTGSWKILYVWNFII